MATTRRGSRHVGPSEVAVAPSMAEYVGLLRALLADDLTAGDFERSYIELFGNDVTLRPEPTFRVLNDLFFAVDAFCPDPALRDADDLDEEQLRDRARVALAALAP